MHVKKALISNKFIPKSPDIQSLKYFRNRITLFLKGLKLVCVCLIHQLLKENKIFYSVYNSVEIEH